MITLITGVPGSGKTLYCVKLILDLVKLREESKKKLQTETDPEKIKKLQANVREIFVDIADFDHDKAGTKPAPEDYRDTPHGSVVVYDECQKKFGPDGHGRSKREDISSFETHRHFGYDLILITQRERLLHAHIRDLVGKHFHVQRQHGTNIARIYQRDETMDTKSTSVLNNVDSFVWSYDKNLFGYYKSAEIHTHKPSMPAWLKTSIIGLCVAILSLGFLAYKSVGFFTGASASESIGSTVPEREDVQTEPLVVNVNVGNATTLTGCASWGQGTQCRCYDTNGLEADMSFSQCMTLVSGSVFRFRPMNTNKE